MTKTKEKSDTGNLDARETETGLTTAGEGVLDPTTNMGDFIKLGFSEERTIKIGDPTKGDAVLAYAGELVGPGPDIGLNAAIAGDREDGKGTIPTWLFHPIDVKTLKPIHAITHKVIAPHQLNDICMGLQALKQNHAGKRVQASFMWVGKIENRVGQPLNKFRSAHRLVNEDGTPFIVDDRNKETAPAEKTAEKTA